MRADLQELAVPVFQSLIRPRLLGGAAPVLFGFNVAFTVGGLVLVEVRPGPASLILCVGAVLHGVAVALTRIDPDLTEVVLRYSGREFRARGGVFAVMPIYRRPTAGAK